MYSRAFGFQALLSYTLVMAVLLLVAGSTLAYATPFASGLMVCLPALLSLFAMSRQFLTSVPCSYILPCQIIFGILFGLMGVILAAPLALIALAFVQRMQVQDAVFVRGMVQLRP